MHHEWAEHILFEIGRDGRPQDARSEGTEILTPLDLGVDQILHVRAGRIGDDGAVAERSGAPLGPALVPEIPVRVAPGAQSADVIRLFLRQGVKLTVIGIMFGLLGAVAISRLPAVVLIDLSPFDPLAFRGVATFLSIVALLACCLPARRATKMDPVVALKYE